MIRSALRQAVINNCKRDDKDSVIETALDLGLTELGKRRDFFDMRSESDLTLHYVGLSFEDGAWTASTKALVATGAFADYTYAAGHEIYISAGTGITAGFYGVASRTSDNAIVLSTSCGDDASDVAATGIGTLRKIALPTGTHHVMRVDVIDGTNSYECGIKSRRHLKSYHYHSHTGRPVVGMREGSNFRFYPMTDGSYILRVDVSILPAALTADGDEITLENADFALIAWATSYLFKSIQQFNVAREWDLEYERAVAALILDDVNQYTKYEHARIDGDGEHLPLRPWEDPFSTAKGGW